MAHRARKSDAQRVVMRPGTAGTLSRLAAARAEQAGIDVAPLMAKAGVKRRQVEDDSVWLDAGGQIRFIELIAEALQDDFLGFHLARDCELGEIGLLHYVLASSSELTDALRRGVRYSATANEGVALTYRERDDVAIALSFVGIARHSDRHQIESWVTVLVRTCRQLTGRHILPRSVQFSHRREGDCAELNTFLGCEVVFGAAVDEIVFPRSIKGAPVISADPHLNRLLIQYCEEALARRATPAGALRSAVENAIAPLLPHGTARVGDIAGKLGMSPRTLARRLASEGLTFGDIVDQLRCDLAQRHIRDSKLSMSQIAWLLGYRDGSAFTHAFKRWTGKTPKQARARGR